MKHALFLIGLPAAVLVGCNTQDATELQQDVAKLSKTAARSANNAQLVARVNATLAQRKGVDMTNLKVSGANGIITLSGSVRTAAERKIVKETVDGIRGVEKIIDRLTVAK